MALALHLSFACCWMLHFYCFLTLAILILNFDDFVQADFVLAVAAEGHATGVYGFDRTHGITLDAGDLHQTADRIAG